jgi:hypothetical protein
VDREYVEYMAGMEYVLQCHSPPPLFEDSYTNLEEGDDYDDGAYR